MTQRRYEETVQRGAEEVARLVGASGIHYADPGETVAQSKEWTDDQLTCRVKGHRFTVPRVAQHYIRYRYFYIELECEGGCGVVQCQEMNERGHVYWSQPRYPNGSDPDVPRYLSRNGRIVGDAKDAIRLEMIYRVFKPRKTNKQDADPHRGWDDAVGDDEAAS
jgi:hypothetical protein